MGKRVLRIAIGAAALLVSSVWAQQNVGIGTNTPHPTALLELYSTSKGLLIPRMTQAERDAISSPATGLLIYQTDNTPGFYYWNGTAWIPLLSSSSGSGLFWSLTGNSITSAWNGSSGNFLGTTNAQPLVIATTNTTTPQPIQFWTGNTERMRITATGNVGIGTSTPGARLHVEDGEIWLFNNGNNTRFVIGDNPTTGQYGWLQWDSNLDFFRIDHSSAPGDGLKLNGNFVSIGNLPVDQPLKVGLGTTEYMRVTTTGNVGIGTTSPSERLDVSNGNIGITNTDGTARELRLYEPFDGTNNYTAFRAQAQTGDIIYTLPASLTPTSTVGAGILQTDASGNLSWLAPSALVTGSAWALTGNSGTNPAVNFLGTTDAQPLVIRTNNTERMRVTATGNVGIGTANPTERLQVSDGNVAITNTDGTARELRLYEPSGAGTNFTAFRAQAQASDIIYTLPASDGSPGQVLTTDGNGQLSWSWNPGTIFVRKTANESVTNSTTPQADDHLYATLPANSIWEVEILLRTQSAGGDANNGGIQVQLNAPTGTSMQVYVEIKKGGSGGDLNHHWHYGWITAPNTSVGYNPIPGTTTQTGAVKLKGLVIVGSTGGTLQLYWAQNAANTNATTVYANSYMKLTRIQ